ncbi:MAG: RNA polymerase sigma-70 factor [Ferruginibacter sp.]
MKKENLQATDKELINAACNGSEAAFKQLYQKYWHDLYKIAYRRLPSDEDVKDILQDTFISLWKNLHHLSVNDSIGGYLYTSLRNKILNYYEKNQLKLKILMRQPFNPIQSEADIYSSLYTKELNAVIGEIVAAMPSKLQEIYLLSKEEQLTNGEIASLLMLAPQTVKNQIHHALSRIRKELIKSNLHHFSFLFY